jgi:hypothetical protein
MAPSLKSDAQDNYPPGCLLDPETMTPITHNHHDYKLISSVLGVVCAILLTLIGWLASRAFTQIDSIGDRVSALETGHAVMMQTNRQVDFRLGEMDRKLDQLLVVRVHSR